MNWQAKGLTEKVKKKLFSWISRNNVWMFQMLTPLPVARSFARYFNEILQTMKLPKQLSILDATCGTGMDSIAMQLEISRIKIFRSYDITLDAPYLYMNDKDEIVLIKRDSSHIKDAYTLIDPVEMEIEEKLGMNILFLDPPWPKEWNQEGGGTYVIRGLDNKGSIDLFEYVWKILEMYKHTYIVVCKVSATWAGVDDENKNNILCMANTKHIMFLEYNPNNKGGLIRYLLFVKKQYYPSVRNWYDSHVRDNNSLESILGIREWSEEHLCHFDSRETRVGKWFLHTIY